MAVWHLGCATLHSEMLCCLHLQELVAQQKFRIFPMHYWMSQQVSDGIIFKKIRRGPKLEGSAFANFGYSSETERKSRFEMGNSCGVSLKTGLVPVPPY